MHTESQDGASWRFAPELTQLLAGGWVAILAFFFLFRYNGWLIPLQLADLFRETMPTLAIGPHFGEFWRAGLTDAGCAAAILATAFAIGAVAIDRLTPEKDLLAALFSLAAGLWILFDCDPARRCCFCFRIAVGLCSGGVLAVASAAQVLSPANNCIGKAGWLAPNPCSGLGEVDVGLRDRGGVAESGECDDATV